VPGSGRARLLALAGISVVVVAVAVVLLSQHGGGASATYGQLPSWLPKATVATGRTVQASEAHPQLAIQGDGIAVHLRHGRVLALAVGPEVPEDGQFPVPKTSPVAFTVTLRAASGAVPLRAGAFTILDEFGHLHHPRVVAPHGATLPARVRAGATVTLTVRDVLPTGGGQLRWSPEGAKPIASWDFDVEID
jgi:hypothetical protein